MFAGSTPAAFAAARAVAKLMRALTRRGAMTVSCTTCASVSQQELKEGDTEARPSKTYAPDVIVRVGHELLGRR
jgi:hypothetical protein